MTVVVSFITPSSHGSASAIHTVRACEHLTIGTSTTAAADPDEMVIVGNAETSMIYVAWGTTPDANATLKSGVTSAGIPVPAGGLSYPIKTKAGDKINVKAVT